ncbi:hypothetical protein OWV82_002174 [Melia azedarach]|uniref:Uncharacterized protein n=1 Tax=Melia azedarach TaxID=155640 RepID=A0ACC1Z0F8_MELAZ|nr:hypothetical protein OWV82_002174 [Melia azedarach]
MATGKSSVSFALVCVIFAVMVAVAMSHEGHEHHHSPAPSPDSPSENGAADISPHLFSTTLLASLALLLTFCLSFIY